MVGNQQGTKEKKWELAIIYLLREDTRGGDFLKYKIWFDFLFKRKYNSVFNIKN